MPLCSLQRRIRAARLFSMRERLDEQILSRKSFAIHAGHAGFGFLQQAVND